MMTWFKLAWREIVNNRRFAGAFCLNFALGLTGYITLDAYKYSLIEELNNGSRAIMASDLEVKSSQRDFTQAEKDILRDRTKGIEVASSTRLFSMVATAKSSRLARVVAISPTYPLIGQIELSDKKFIESKSAKEILDEPKVWVYPEILIQLNLKVGDSLKIGDASFKIADVIVKDAAGIGSSFNFAPYVYIGEKFLPSTRLVRENSRYNVYQYYKFEDQEQLPKVTEELKASMQSPDLDFTTHHEASEELARSLTQLNDYLGLIALIALFLAAIGGAYLYRSFLIKKLTEIATLLSLGVTHNQIQATYIIQLALLGLISGLGALGFSYLALKFLPALTQSILPIVVTPHLSLKVVSIALLIGFGGSVLICLPLLTFLRDIKPARLFQESKHMQQSWHPKLLLAIAPAVFLYWAMAVWESNSYKMASIFVGSLFGFCIIFIFFAKWLFRFLLYVSDWSSLHLRMALRSLGRNQLSTGSCFLTISLATLLITIIPQMRSVLLEDISNPQSASHPSLFLADIQDDQIEPLKELFKEKNIPLQNVSPMVRARLTKIEGKEIEKVDESQKGLTREEQSRQWARTRGQNLTVRPKITDAEKIVDGQEFSGVYDWQSGKPAEISVERRYARRLNIGVGSKLSFDVQEVPVEAEVVNIRTVRWTSFQPNFFIMFQPGVFDDAPKTYLASVANVGDEKKQILQSSIVEKFPNISMIDVTRTIESILGIITKMEWIIKVMAYFAIFAGFVVLFSIANHQASVRRWDINLLKVVGAKFSDIRTLIVFEFGILGLFSSLVGVTASLLVACTFSYLIFDSPWSVNIWLLVGTVVSVTLLSVVVSLLATMRVLREKPLSLLQST